MYDIINLFIKNSITMSLLILVYMGINRLFSKDYRAKWRYYSWLIIIIGLIIPFRPELTISLHENSKIAQIFNIKQAIPVRMSNEVITTKVMSQASVISWHYVLAVLWLLGFLTFLVYHVYRHWKFAALVKRWGERINEPQIEAILHQLQEELKISKLPKLMVCTCIDSPMLIGFMKPVILLPDINNSLDEISLMIKHELIHYKRKDLWYKSLVVFVTALYWFHPLMYFMAKEISMQCEISCDEEVVKGAGFPIRQKYSAMIIASIKKQSNIKQSVYTTNFYSRTNKAKNRILSVMNMKKKRLGLVSSSLLVIGIMVMGIQFTSMKINSSAASLSPVTVGLGEKLNKYELVLDLLNENKKSSKSVIDNKDKEYSEQNIVATNIVYAGDTANGITQGSYDGVMKTCYLSLNDQRILCYGGK
ncbi:M56 family metallopeptidase [Anaerosacchariphilus polymeriproducens]|uniref:Peptidase M56 domain-containing protein n=1 Tax=Anaerosacchariphilus polymeriproducens TaxID=1812858 RepID=A0A371AWE4_9FIRM|nr:M56 family metallopeptidase [Anaerosacchariphilus polymeriproducens]RDU23852.1 hypothetical protein DWV06_08315 [Anaerosacchariphilus polymeriproducens]